MLARALVVVALLATMAAAEGRWHIDIPEGWTDVTSELAGFSEVTSLRDKAKAEGGDLEIQAHRGPANEHVDALFVWDGHGARTGWSVRQRRRTADSL